MTISPARLAAGYPLVGVANAQLSTGPRTPEGKAASRNNALTHGAHATDDTILAAPTSPATTYLADLTADFSPKGAIETLLVKRLATLAARLDLLSDGLDNLLALNQRQALNACLQENYDAGGPTGDLRDTPHWSAALRRFDRNEATYPRDLDSARDPDPAACTLAYTLSSPRAALLLRHDAAVERRLHATLAQLERQQALRQKAERSPRYSSPQALLDALGIPLPSTTPPTPQASAPTPHDRIEANAAPPPPCPDRRPLQLHTPIASHRNEPNSTPPPLMLDLPSYHELHPTTPVCPPALAPYPWCTPQSSSLPAPSSPAVSPRPNQPNTPSAT